MSNEVAIGTLLIGDYFKFQGVIYQVRDRDLLPNVPDYAMVATSVAPSNSEKRFFTTNVQVEPISGSFL